MAVKWLPESRRCRRHRDMAFSVTVGNDGSVKVHSHLDPADVAHALQWMAQKITASRGGQ